MQTDSDRPRKKVGAYLRHELTMHEAAYLHISEELYRLKERMKKLEEKLQNGN